jgi:signal transduction histidine kinase
LISPLKILLLEDDPLDAKLIKATLKEAGIPFDIIRVQTRDDFIATIERREFDIVFADYQLPGFDGLSALAIAKAKCPGVPFIFVSGKIGEELAIDTLTSGATDYVMKSSLSRLVPSVQRALREATERSERAKAVRELEKSHNQLRNLAVHLQCVREEERANIAREMHDELGQMLTALKMDIAWLQQKYSDHTEILVKSNSMLTIVNETIRSVKRIYTELRPSLLDHLGLGAAMEWQAEEFQRRSKIECTVSLEPGDITVDIDLAIVFFRIFQEALTNVVKHANATKVEASLKREYNRIVLEIHDNGVGISGDDILKINSFGFLEMRERLYPLGGTISFEGKKNMGTTLTVIIPGQHVTSEK